MQRKSEGTKFQTRTSSSQRKRDQQTPLSSPAIAKSEREQTEKMLWDKKPGILMAM